MEHPGMKDYHISTTPCPHCGHPIDGAAAVASERAPEPGDVTICIYCADILEFDEHMVLRRCDIEKLEPDFLDHVLALRRTAVRIQPKGSL
jgi:hypothetical protein